MKHIAMVAGEPSGDLLASRIIRGIQAQAEATQFQGIGGPQMMRCGFDSRYPMDTLSIFGYADAIKTLPKLLHTF